ncbi:MAG TPA: ABC transporter permease [Acidobacteriaceae bacterium]|jgi:predicted permease|nr:ABC transporter permease [Acidobacteriaceae bacterium]
MFNNLIAGIRALFHRKQRNAEIHAELSSFLEASIDEKMRRGLSREQAEHAAHAEMASTESVRHKVWSASWESTAESLFQDLRFALRQLRRNPGFATTAILILTLGIAASVAIFSFVDAALIRPLPFQNASSLVILFENNSLGPRFHLSYKDYIDWKNQNTVFSNLEIYAPWGFMMQTPAGTQKADGALVSANFFRTLGVTPAIGRDFRPDEDQAGAARPVLLTYAGWQRLYGARADITGQTVVLDNQPNTIIGVLPRDFHFQPTEPADFFATERPDGACEKDRGCHNQFGLARLRPGVSLAAAMANMKNIAGRLALQYPDSNRDRGAFMLPITDLIVGDVRPILLVLLAGAALLLLIATVNVASLLLVRSETRKREIAVRGAIGASRARLLLQFVTEGVVLASVAGILGSVLACAVMRYAVGLVPKDMFASMPYLYSIGFNFRVFIFAALISFAAAALFSIIPAVRVTLSDLREDLNAGGRGAAGTVWRRFGSNLVVVELALAVVLLAGAGLLGKSFYRLLHVDTGLVPDHLATLQVSAQSPAYQQPPAQIALEREIQSRLSTLPGVRSIAFTSQLPLGDGDGTIDLDVFGGPPHKDLREVADREVSPGYFSTIRARLVRGRWFTEDEDSTKSRVGIINQQLAKQFFPGEDPIGQQVFSDSRSKSHIRIIGVISDIQEGQLDAAPRAAIYMPFNQAPDNDFAVILRTTQTEDAVLSSATAAIHSIDPVIAVHDPITMTQRLHDSPSAWFHRSSAWLVGCFAALALILSVVGLYGVISYSVSQRTREIGVRMALGAQRSSVYRLILREAGRLAFIGIAAGLLCSLAATTLLRSLLFRVQTWDVTTLAAVALTLGAAALLASYLPARRAASVNPTEALHAE